MNYEWRLRYELYESSTPPANMRLAFAKSCASPRTPEAVLKL
jgi:hypothetical protein